jgi:hypothetical protein
MRPSQPVNQPGPAPVGSHGHSKTERRLSLFRLSVVGLLFCATILVVALVIFIAIGNKDNGSREHKLVDTKHMQAVFLNGGQVYFGNIRTLNSKYMRVDGIFYLRVNQQVQPNQSTTNQQQDISLVKLGCELHGPTDSMVINREQVTFWENLKDDGQVAKAVATYKQQNPDGQKCDTPASGAETPATPAAPAKKP